MLETENLKLRHLQLDDAAKIHILSEEPAYRQWLPSQVYADEAEARETLEFLICQCVSPANPKHGPYVLAVIHKSDNSLIGHVGLSPFDDDVEIGFAIGEAYHRKRLATEMVVATCEWAFAEFKLPKILAITAQANEGSRMVLSRAGFEHQRNRNMCFQGIEQTVSVYYLIK